MATLTIRNLPDKVRDRLRVRAATKGRSMEAEARDVLTAAVSEEGNEPRSSLAEAIREVQDALAPYAVEGVSMVDELIAERRIEAWTETLEGLKEAWESRERLKKSPLR